jgi:iron complex outermembrane receptor protein
VSEALNPEQLEQTKMQRRITLALIAAALSGAPGALAQDSAPANEQKPPAQDAPASTPPVADAPAPELPDVEIQQKAEEPAQQVQPAAPAKTKTAAPKEYYQPVAAKPKNKAAAPPPQAVQQPAAEPFDASQDQASQATGLENPKGAFNGPVAKSTTSGTKTGTPIIEIPQGISVVGAEQISRQNADTIVAATRYAPGIRSETFGGDTRNDWFLIRGFPAQDTGLYLNGLQLFSTAFATWKIEPQGLERLEIIRGPSSVLYGGGNPGGLINAISKRPGPGLEQSLSTGIDEYGNAYGAMDVSGQIGGTGEVFYRFNALGRIGDTQVDDIENDRIFIAPSLMWKPNSDTSVVVLASYQRDKTAIQNFLPYVGTVVSAPYGRISTDFNTNNPGYGSFEREQFHIGYEFEHQVSEAFTLRQNFRYSHVDVDLLGLYGLGYSSPPTATSGVISRGNFITTPVADQFTVDNQAEFLIETGPLAHRILAGLDYKSYTIDDEQGFEFRFADLDLANPVYPGGISAPTSRYLDATTTQQQLGLYLQDQIKIDRLTVALSGRHDWVETDRDDDLSPAGTVKVNEDSYSGRAGAIYNFDNGLAPYIAYSTSFNPLVGLNATTGTLLEPEKGHGWETGIKYEPTFMNARFTVGYFDITRTNVPTTDPATFAVFQIGKATSKGWEFEGVATLAPGLDLISSYTSYDLVVVEDVDPAAVGNLPVATPEQFGGVFLDYTFQNGPLKGFGFGGGARYVGRSFADVENTLEVPSYWLADLALHYDWEGWRTQINVTNLFDDTYVSACSDENSCFYGERRKAMISATYKW